GGDPSAERRMLERLRKVAEGKSPRVEGFFERGPIDAGLKGRGSARLIEGQKLVERRRIERDDGLLLRPSERLYAADDARPAAEWDDGERVLGGLLQDGRHRFVVPRVDDGVRRRLDL